MTRIRSAGKDVSSPQFFTGRGTRLRPVSDPPKPQTPAGIPTQARRLMQRHPDLWNMFMLATDRLADMSPDVEVEDWSVFYNLFRQLRSLGFPFDAAFIDSLERMNEAMALTADDGDPPELDADLEYGDPECRAGGGLVAVYELGEYVALRDGWRLRDMARDFIEPTFNRDGGPSLEFNGGRIAGLMLGSEVAHVA